MDTSYSTRQGGEEEERTKTRGGKRKKEAKPTKEVGTSEQVGVSGGGGKDRDKPDRREKAKTRAWFNIVKGLKMEDELGTPNSDKRRNES